jgi:hypothetical protein
LSILAQPICTPKATLNIITSFYHMLNAHGEQNCEAAV